MYFEVNQIKDDECLQTRLASFSLLSDITVEEGNVAATLLWISVLRWREAQPGSSKLVRRRPGGERLLSQQGEGEEIAHKSSTTCPLSASKGKGGEKGNRNGPAAVDPARAAFKLRFHNLSQGASANGTRARRRANHRRVSSGRRPMAARVLGAWAKQAAFLGCRVWAVVGASSYLGCTWFAVLLRGFCVQLLRSFPCASFFFFFFLFFAPRAAPGWEP